MKQIVNLCYNSSPDVNAEKIIELFDEKFLITRIGLNYDLKLMEKILDQLNVECDIIALSGLPDPVKLNGKYIEHKMTKEIKSKINQRFKLSCGTNLRSVFIPSALRIIGKKNKEYFKYKSIGFFSGIVQYSYLESFEQLNPNTYFADPYLFLGLPVSLKSKFQLEKMISTLAPLISRFGLKQSGQIDFTKKTMAQNKLMASFVNSEIWVSNETQLNYLKLDDLSNKTIILDRASKAMADRLKSLGAAEVISCFPDIKLSEEEFDFISFPVLEAIFLSILALEELSFDDIYPFIEKYDIYPKSKLLARSKNDRAVKKFSFLVHPLKKEDIFKIKLIRPLGKIDLIKNFSEKLSKKIPGMKLGEISGIKSQSTGNEVKGDIYVVFETPAALMSSDPDQFYSKVQKLCVDAMNKGSEIFGLGAYTKIVGDAGLSIAKRSPIPVTTGNTLSATSTLWAAAYAVDKMGFVSKIDSINQGTVVVIGATGSIGRVCAKVLAANWSKMILVATRGHKLLELRDELQELFPNCEFSVSTNTNQAISNADLILTSTSNRGAKLLDIMVVKPGAVICDVSRPFDIQEDEAIMRPDVLVIASGEVELPGQVKLTCDIGLPGTTVYACLAETAILALENRFECYSLSRELDYVKVKEMDELSRKHGVKLASIMSHQGEITNEQIHLCRMRATSLRQDILPNGSRGKKNKQGKGIEVDENTI